MIKKKKKFEADSRQEQNKYYFSALEPGIQVYTLGHAYKHNPT